MNRKHTDQHSEALGAGGDYLRLVESNNAHSESPRVSVRKGDSNIPQQFTNSITVD